MQQEVPVKDQKDDLDLLWEVQIRHGKTGIVYKLKKPRGQDDPKSFCTWLKLIIKYGWAALHEATLNDDREAAREAVKIIRKAEGDVRNYGCGRL
jgi:hypothetical protein